MSFVESIALVSMTGWRFSGRYFNVATLNLRTLLARRRRHAALKAGSARQNTLRPEISEWAAV
jgi:hypothetical protein